MTRSLRSKATRRMTSLNNRRVDHIQIQEGVVPSERDNEVRGVFGNAFELASEVARGASVDRAKCRLPRGGKEAAKVADHVWSATRVRLIVEDRVSEERDVGGHRRGG